MSRKRRPRPQAPVGSHIGSFGTPDKPPAPVVTFDYFDRKGFRSSPSLGQGDMLWFLHLAGSVAVDDPTADKLVFEFMESVIHPDDYREFVRLALRHRQDTAEIFQVGSAIVEAVTQRPTGLPSGSSDGQQTDATRSEDGSLLQAIEGEPAWAQMVILDSYRAQKAG